MGIVSYGKAKITIIAEDGREIDMAPPRDIDPNISTVTIDTGPLRIGDEVRIDYLSDIEPLPARKPEPWQTDRNRKIRRR